MSTRTKRQWRLAARPDGTIRPEDFEWEEEPVGSGLPGVVNLPCLVGPLEPGTIAPGLTDYSLVCAKVNELPYWDDTTGFPFVPYGVIQVNDAEIAGDPSYSTYIHMRVPGVYSLMRAHWQAACISSSWKHQRWRCPASLL